MVPLKDYPITIDVKRGSNVIALLIIPVDHGVGHLPVIVEGGTGRFGFINLKAVVNVNGPLIILRILLTTNFIKAI